MSISVPEFLSTIFPDGNMFTTNSTFSYKPFTSLSPNEAQYYAICAVSGHRRKNENFLSLNVLVCDDINTKAKIPPLPPSYIIETSLNNFQYGYILKTPETDPQRAKDLIQLLIRSGYTDPQSTGIVRLVRLPIGVNGKDDDEKRNYSVTLKEWHPDRKYSYNQLIGMLKSHPSNSEEDYGYEPPDDIYEGQRNTEMTRLFGHLLNKYGSNEAAIILIDYNYEHCHPPLSNEELSTIVKSITERQRSRLEHYINDIYHIRESGTWYDFRGHTHTTGPSLNTTYSKEFPGKKGSLPLITKWLPHQDGFNEAKAVSWFPVPYGQNKRTLVYGDNIYINSWHGFNAEPVPGPTQPWFDLLTHLITEEDYRNALLYWIAYTIQHPDKKMSWQPILLGCSGAGKDALFRPIATILGKAYKTIGNKDIQGNYDDGLYQTKLLHISEASGLRGGAIEFYKRITASEANSLQMLNIKCAGKVYQESICNVLVITNNLDAMKFSKDERRAFVLRAHTPLSEEQANTYFDWLEQDGANHLFDYLLSYPLDTAGYSPTVLPYRTRYLTDLFTVTQSDFSIDLEEFLNDYDIALPEHLAKIIPSDSHYTNSIIIKWLEESGWTRWDNGLTGRRIKRKINGEFCSPKSRLWYVRKSSKFYNSTPTDMCIEVERVESIWNNIIKNKSKF